MNVLSDRHHSDLLFSLQLLFEDRLGAHLYVPIGRDWWDEGYVQFGKSTYGDDRLGRQFLSYGDDGELDAAWQIEMPDFERTSLYRVTADDQQPERLISGVTREQFLELGDWAFVIASVPDNYAGFKRLAEEVGARFVIQCGNTGQRVDWSLEPLALISAEAEIPEGARGVRYHQEIDPAVFGREAHLGFFRSKRPTRIGSFVNLLPNIAYWPKVQALRAELEPEFEFLIHGEAGEHGKLSGVAAIADVQRSCGWGLHTKTGDGFGHVLHSWAAIGRPLIGYAKPYADKMGGPLWEDGVTSVNLDERTVEEAGALIREISADADRHGAMCRAIRARFDELVDYDAEERQIRALLGL